MLTAIQKLSGNFELNFAQGMILDTDAQAAGFKRGEDYKWVPNSSFTIRFYELSEGFRLWVTMNGVALC